MCAPANRDRAAGSSAGMIMRQDTITVNKKGQIETGLSGKSPLSEAAPAEPRPRRLRYNARIHSDILLAIVQEHP